MNKRTEKTILKVTLGVLVVAVLTVGSIIVTAISVNKNPKELFEDDSEDVAITGDALELASDAALAYIGQGKVTETEVGDEEGYYEVEITLDNGEEIDVHLDENFNVLGSESDED